MIRFTSFLLLISLMLFSVQTQAEEFQPGSKYVAKRTIKTQNGETFEAGSYVKGLGVVEVSKELVASGLLFTFLSYEDRFYNADFADFEKINDKLIYDFTMFRSDIAGSHASLCGGIINRNGDLLVFSPYFAFEKYIRIKTLNGTTPNYTLSWKKDKNTNFCITGLDHSTDYEVTLLSGFRDLKEDLVSYGTTGKKKPRIYVDSSRSILPLTKDALLPISTINIDALEVEIIRIDERTLTNVRDIFRSLDLWDKSNIQKKYGQHLGATTIELPKEPNVEQELNINVNDIITDIQPGIYVAVFDNKALNLERWESRPTQWFVISNIGITSYSGINETRLELRDFANVKEIQNASVQFIAKNNRVLYETKTDSNGNVTVPNSYLEGTDGSAPNYLFVSSKDGDFSILNITDLKSKPHFLSSGMNKLTNLDVYFTTDREMYRPGDVINYMGIGRTLDLKALKDVPFNIIVRSPDGTELSVTEVSGDNQGMFKGNYKIKSSAFLGRYNLEIRTKDEKILTSTSVRVSDFVPLTIETKVKMGESPWSVDKQNKFSLESKYYSGGDAALLKGEYSLIIKRSRIHENKNLEGYVFGALESETINIDTQTAKFNLSETGTLERDINLALNKNNLSGIFSVYLKASIFDVGGRPNVKRITHPLSTSATYLGVRPDFEGRLPVGGTPRFEIKNVDRLGVELPFQKIDYAISKINYSYNWTYDRNISGWNWHRVRNSSEKIDSGTLLEKTLQVKTQLQWGVYELSLKDEGGSETTFEFYVGWGSDGQTSAQPEKLNIFTESLSSEKMAVRFEAPFSGIASVNFASTDIISSRDVIVNKGPNEFVVDTPKGIEPGFHTLMVLKRPVSKGSEHLPQFALGTHWIEVLSEKRKIDLTVTAKKKIRSNETLTIEFSTNATKASALVFLVDEGIQNLTDFKNLNPVSYFYGKRELPIGILTNYGQLIRQNENLKMIQSGGDEDLGGLSSSIMKSNFFKTVSYASDIIPLTGGKATLEIPETNFEGRARLISIISSEHGLAFNEASITIQDPVSLDISLPRFVAPNDKLYTKLGVRTNEKVENLQIKKIIGDKTDGIELSLNNKQGFNTELNFSPKTPGVIPVSINAHYNGGDIARTFEIISRPASYPFTELSGIPLRRANWLGSRVTEIPALQTNNFDIVNQDNLKFITTLSDTQGVDMVQIFAALDRYPYGCIEQTSSTTRGLIFRENLKDKKSKSRKKAINSGLEKIIAKQGFQGSFGYWNKYDRVFEEYQPYAVETLMLGLPFSNDPQLVSKSIRKGLEYLVSHEFLDWKSELYSLGLLTKSGYEVTSRIRYIIDHKVLRKSLRELETIALGYWLADLIDDKKRLTLLHAKLSEYSLSKEPPKLIRLEPEIGSWKKINTISNSNSKPIIPKTASFLANVSEKNQTKITQDLVASTRDYMTGLQYRSTYTNANLARILLATQKTISEAKIRINGEPRSINEDGSINIDISEFRSGFNLTHDQKHQLFLNVETIGKRKSVHAINNGFLVLKKIYDNDGNYLNSYEGLTVKQGDVFTVVISFQSNETYSGNILLTDLLPSGFEFVDDKLDKRLGEHGLKYYKYARTPDYSQLMDDRFVANFRIGASASQKIFIGYRLRAVYPGEMVLPDTHVELMYQPHLNGRSKLSNIKVER